jgi:hypothetical protein
MITLGALDTKNGKPRAAESASKLKMQFMQTDAFSVLGTWWLPGKDNSAHRGTLSFSPTEILLTVDGGFDEPSIQDFGKLKTDFDRFGCIHGRGDDGKPHKIDWYLTQVWRVCDFLRLLTDEPIRPISMQVSIPGESGRCWLLWRSAESGQDDDDSPYVLLFYFAHFRDSFGELLKNWFALDDLIVLVSRLYRDGHRGGEGRLESRFLVLCHALEAFSRATTASEYMATDKYEVVKSQLIAAIPESVGSDHRSALKSRIKFGNEHSLRKRLDGLLKSLAPASVECICRDPDRLISGIVSTRNYLTHYTDELKPLALTGAALLRACDRLLMFLRILLLRQLGIQEDLIVSNINEHPRLMQHILRYKKEPECVDPPSNADVDKEGE